MELAEQSVGGLFLDKGDTPLGLHHDAPPEKALGNTVHTEIKSFTAQIISFEGHKLELPIPSEANTEPISPAEVTLEECGLALAPQEATEEEAAGNDNSKDSEDRLTSSDLGVPDEITAVHGSDSNSTEPLYEFIVQKDSSEAPVSSGTLDPKALLDSSALAKEATCANGITEDPTTNTSTPDEKCPKNCKSARKNIPPKKDRMEPLKMDMSRPTVIPLSSSQMSLQCLECHIIFSDNKSKERHLKMNHPTEYEQCMLGDSLFACYVCDQHFVGSTELMAHQRTHTEKQPFKCPMCGEAYRRLSELTNHKKVHFGKHGYACSDCGKHCKTLTLLKYHQRKHTGERPYICIHKECGMRFSMPKALKRHLEEHETGDSEGIGDPVNGTTSTEKKRGPSTKKFACSQCDKSFNTAKSQLHHIKTKHIQCKSHTSSSSTVVVQEVNGNPPVTTSVLQPPVLRMEAIGPAPQQIGPLGAEQIKRLIEKLGNVQKVNQLVILGVDQLPYSPQTLGMQQPHVIQPLHFNFTEPSTQPVVVQHMEEQPEHKGTLSTESEQTADKQSLEVGMAVEQAAVVQEEKTMVLSVNSEEPVPAVELDMTEAQLNEVQIEFVPELVGTSASAPQLEGSDEHIPATGEPASDVNTVESGDASSLISTHFESHQLKKIEEDPVSVPTDMNSEQTITHEESQRQKPDDFESGRSQTTEEELVLVPSDTMAAEEIITHEESLGQKPNEANLLEEIGPQTEQVSVVTFNDSQDLEGQTEKDTPCTNPPVFQPCLNKVQNKQESSCLELQGPSESVIQSSTVLNGKPVLSDVEGGLHVQKILPVKKKRSKKQAAHKSKNLELQVEAAKGTSHTASPQKSKPSSKAIPKKREKAKSKKLVHLGPKEKCSKKQALQISKISPLKSQQDTNVGKASVSSQNEDVPQVKQKNQKHKKGKTVENSSGVKKAFNVCGGPKVPEASRGKTSRKKLEKQKDLAKKRKSQETQQDETPLPKKKKQGKAQEEVPQKKTKVKSTAPNEARKATPKLAKQRQKEKKNASQSSSPDQIKEQALLLLKGHKQPQLKVHKLDPKTTGLEQPLKAKCQTKDVHKEKALKAKGGAKNKALQKGSQKKKKTKMVGKDSKKKKISPFQIPSIDIGLNSPLSSPKPKVPRKRKAPTKIDQEIALSPPFSRLTIGCHDCGKKFSEVSALQEHMASMHSENGLLLSPVSDPTMSPRSNEMILTNAVPLRNFEIQVPSDWDMDPEMREIGLGDREEHRLSFPALSPSPSFPLASTCVEGEGKVDRVCQDTYSGHLGENSKDNGQAFPTASIESATCHVQMAKSVGMENVEVVPPSSVYGPQEGMDIKEELPSDVNLVMVEDQNEGDAHGLANDLLNSQEGSGQQEEESSHELNHTITPSQIQLPEEGSRDPASTENSRLTEESEIKQEEEEMLVQKAENRTKASMTRSRRGRGGRGRGKRYLGKRGSADKRSRREMEADKEECHVVFELYSLCEEKNDDGDKQKEVNSATTANPQSALKEQPQPGPTTAEEVVNDNDQSLISNSGQQVNNGIVFENFQTPQRRKQGGMSRQGNPPPEASSGTSSDVKLETSASIPTCQDVIHGDRDILQGVQVFLVKAEDHEPHVLQGNQHTQTQATCLDGILSGSSAVPQPAGRQCIFYPVKEEDGELQVEPPLGEEDVPVERTGKSGSWAASELEECEEVSMGCTPMEMHHPLYSSSEEGDVGTEQQSSQGFLEFLSQSSDTEDIDNLQSEPEAETHVMSCYHGIRPDGAGQRQEMSGCDQTPSNSTNIGSTQADHQGGGRKNCWKPVDYFIRYFSWDTWKEIAACTGQASKLPKPVTEKEVAQFVGIHIAMGTLKFPSMKLYWDDHTRVPLIADAMPASRFSELACKLRLSGPVANLGQHGQNGTHELSTTVETPGEASTEFHQSRGHQDAPNCPDTSVSNADPLWKVKAIVNRVRDGCRALKRHGNHGVDQYPLPFQRHPTHSLHHTVMTNVTGLVMDFNLRINDSSREEVVEQMVSWGKGDNQGMIFLCKPELSTPSMLEHLLELGVRSAGKVGGARGQVGDEFMTSDGKLKLFRCHHGFILSAVTKERSRSTSLVSGFERAIKAANLNRDLRSLYRTPCTSSLPGAWPLYVLWDLIDLALVNCWLQYKNDRHHDPEPLSLMEFRLEVSKALILPSTDAQESSATYPPAAKSPSPNTATAAPSEDFETPFPDSATRYDGLEHWPEQLAEGEEARCRFGGCERTSRVRCLKCCVFLCISRNHNCFRKFHSQGAV